MKKLGNLIYPPHCIFCEEPLLEHTVLCNRCIDSMIIKPRQPCTICGFDLGRSSLIENTLCSNVLTISEPIHITKCTACLNRKLAFDRIIYSSIYNQELARLIAMYKYEDNLNVTILLVKLMNLAFIEARISNIDIITIVPMHYFKIFLRNYHHLGVLVKPLTKQWKIPYEPNLLKAKFQPNQATLNGAARVKKSRNKFSINYQKYAMIQNKNILLIDDVITTGATINACALELRKAGAKSITILALARVEGSLKI